MPAGDSTVRAATAAGGDVGGHEPSRPLLCLGEAMVDLVGVRRGVALNEIRGFEAHLGGTAANVAVAAAATGAPVALAGIAGDDDWGRWLLERLSRRGVDTRWFSLLPGLTTQLAFVSVDEAGEPTYRLYREPIEQEPSALAQDVPEAVGSSAALLIGTNTLTDAAHRGVTLDARQRALARGIPVIFDCNIRMHRWPSPGAAADAARECIPESSLVRLNLDEAMLLTGEADPERAAAGLLEAGARQVVVGLGSGGSILRGLEDRDVDAVPADVISTMGAGDCFTATLAGRFVLGGLEPSAIAAALDDAAAAAGRACERWGAVD